MTDLQASMQRQIRPQEGLALTWESVPGAIRYGFVIGFPDTPVPPLEEIMKGSSKSFAVMGVPASHTGAVDLGTPAGEERLYGLVAYKSDGSILPVASVQYVGARSAPRDREYHPLTPPALLPPPVVDVAATDLPTPLPEESVQSSPADPWDILDSLSQSQAVSSRSSAPQEKTSDAQHDPWDVLGPPATEAKPSPVDTSPLPKQATTAPTTDSPGASTTPVQQTPAYPEPVSAEAKRDEPVAIPELHTHVREVILPVSPVEKASEKIPPATRDQTEVVLNPLVVHEVEAPTTSGTIHRVEPTPAGPAHDEQAATAHTVASMTDVERIGPNFPITPDKSTNADIQHDVPLDSVISPIHETVDDASTHQQPERVKATPTSPQEAKAAEIQPEVPTPADPLPVPHPPTAREGETSLWVGTARSESRASRPEHATPNTAGDENVHGDDTKRYGSGVGETAHVEPEATVKEAPSTPIIETPTPSLVEQTTLTVSDHHSTSDVEHTTSPQTEHNELSESASGKPLEVVTTSRPQGEPTTKSSAAEVKTFSDKSPATTKPSDPPAIVTPIPLATEGPQQAVDSAPQRGEQSDSLPPASVKVDELPAAIVVEPVALAPEPAHLNRVTPDPLPKEPELGSIAASLPGLEAGVAVPSDVEEHIDATPPSVTEHPVANGNDVSAPLPARDAKGEQSNKADNADPTAPVGPKAGSDDSGAPIQPVAAEARTSESSTTPVAGSVDVEIPPPVKPRVQVEQTNTTVEVPMPVEPVVQVEQTNTTVEIPTLVEPVMLETNQSEREAVGQKISNVHAPPTHGEEVGETKDTEPRVEEPGVKLAKDAPDPVAVLPDEPADKAPASHSGDRVAEPLTVEAHKAPEEDVVPVLDTGGIEARTDSKHHHTLGPPTSEVTIAVDLTSAQETKVAALLDEADVYLLPSWLDLGEAQRLLAEAAAIAPQHPRVKEMQAQLQTTTGVDEDTERLVQDAQHALEQKEYWQAVDLFEQVLARQRGHESAEQGLEKARLLARWSAQLESAGGHALRLHDVGDQFAGEAPELAEQAYTKAFTVEPSVPLLELRLSMLARSGDVDSIAKVALEGIAILQQYGAVSSHDSHKRALQALQSVVASASTAATINESITHLIQSLI